jgi:hypothetical protein
VVGRPERAHPQMSPHQTRVGCSYPVVTRHQWWYRAIAWVDGLSSARTLRLNTWPIGFICGIAVSALGIWLFSVPPAAQGIAAVRDGAPERTVESVSEVAARAESVSRATLAAPAVETGVPAAWDSRDQSDSLAAVRPQTSFRGTLAVSSWPPGARVFINGTAVGTTPVVLPAVPVGSRVVRLEADGYQLWSSAVRVIANQQTRVTATLHRQPSRP